MTGTLVLNAGRFTFAYGSSYTGTIEAEGGSYSFTDEKNASYYPVSMTRPTLDDVTWIGPLDLTGAAVIVYDLVVQSDVNRDPGTVTLNNSTLDVYDGVLNNVLLNATGGSIEIDDYGGTLELGAQAQVVASGPTTTVDLVAPTDSYLRGNGTIVNQGTIAISNGATVVVGGTNTGFNNTGLITVNGSLSRILLNETLSAASLGSIVADGGWLELDGLFSNSDHTISFGGGSGFSGLKLGGTVSDGTIDNLGGSFVAYGGKLSSVVWEGTLAIGPGGFGLSIENGFTVVPTGGGKSIIDILSGGSLNFLDSESIANAAIEADGYTNIGSEAGLTIDASTTISVDLGAVSNLYSTNGLSEEISLYGNALVNFGLI